MYIEEAFVEGEGGGKREGSDKNGKKREICTSNRCVAF
jgi:hypothetical protein